MRSYDGHTVHERRVVVVGYDDIELVDVASVTSCLDSAGLGHAAAAADRGLAFSALTRVGHAHIQRPGRQARRPGGTLAAWTTFTVFDVHRHGTAC